MAKSLAAGKPLVIMHHGRDQPDNAARVVTRGAGLRVPRKAPEHRIAAAVALVLEDGSFAGAEAKPAAARAWA